MIKEILEAIDEGIVNFKVGDLVNIKSKWEDSEDDGVFEIIEITKNRALIRTITHKGKFRFIPTEKVLLSYLEPERNKK